MLSAQSVLCSDSFHETLETLFEKKPTEKCRSTWVLPSLRPVNSKSIFCFAKCRVHFALVLRLFLHCGSYFLRRCTGASIVAPTAYVYRTFFRGVVSDTRFVHC